MTSTPPAASFFQHRKPSPCFLLCDEVTASFWHRSLFFIEGDGGKSWKGLSSIFCKAFEILETQGL